MSTLSQQAAAVETAQRILAGAVKLPSVRSSQAQLLVEHLKAAAQTLREIGHG